MKPIKDFEHIARRQGGLNKHLTAGQMSMLAIGGAIALLLMGCQGAGGGVIDRLIRLLRAQNGGIMYC